MFGARKRGLIRQKLEIIRFFISFISIWIQTFPKNNKKKSNFMSIRESLRSKKFYFVRFAKVYAREIFQFFFFSPNLLAALDNPLIIGLLA